MAAGSQPGVADRRGRDRDLDRLGQVDAPKHNAAVGRCRTQRDLDTLAAMQTHANGAGEGLQGALLQHLGIIAGGARPCLGGGIGGGEAWRDAANVHQSAQYKWNM